MFAVKLLTCTADIALGESIGIWTGSPDRGGESDRRIVDAAGALAHARRGVAIHHAGRKGLGLRQDRGQTWRRGRDRDSLLRKANRRTFLGRLRRRPCEAKNEHAYGEP